MSQSNSGLKGKTILIVDDEPDLKEVLALSFQMLGCKTLEASSGNEAIALLETHQVDAVISDVRMPNGTGVDLLTEVRKKNKNTPVLLLITGFSDLTEAEALKKGANGLLEKPVDRKKLAAMIEAAFAKL